MSEDNSKVFNLITESSFIQYNERLDLKQLCIDNKIKNKSLFQLCFYMTPSINL